MTTKMKGLLKGLRYISQIFDNNNYEEKEMQIGYPTDVKHVAHIGWDGPSVNSPSWMNEFRSTPEYSSGPTSRSTRENSAPTWPSENLTRTGAGIIDSPARDTPELPKPSRRNPSPGSPSSIDSKPSRRSQLLPGSPSSIDSPTRERSNLPKQSRRYQSAGVSINSPTRDSPESTKPTRRQQNSSLNSSLNSGLGVESPTHGQPSIPKHARRKTTKGSSGGGSIRSSRTKGQSPLAYTSPFSDPGSGSGSDLKNNELCPTSPLKAYPETMM